MSDTTTEHLRFLVGAFAGSDRMHASEWAPGGPATSMIEATGELSGDIIVQRYAQLRDGKLSFEILAVWMVDPATGEVLFYGFDSAGFPPDPPARGTWHANDLVLDRATPRGTSRLIVTPDAAGWSWSKQFRGPQAETWTPVFDAVFTRSVEPQSSSAS